MYKRVLYQIVSRFLTYFDQLTTHYEIPGLLNGAQTCATHDTASGINTINTKLARSRGYEIETFDKPRLVKTLKKRQVRSEGILKLRWAYPDDPEKQVDIVLHAVSNSPHDLIFGFPFLKANGFLEDHEGRVMSRQIWGPWSLTHNVCFQNSLESNLPTTRGTLGSREVQALADTGCDVNVMSRSYAEENGYLIDSRYQEALKFSDGSTDTTIGRVVSPWVFGNSGIKHTLAFEVLEDCQFDVVLGKHILFGTKAFKTYRESFDFGEEDASGDGGEIPADSAHNPADNKHGLYEAISHFVNSVRRAWIISPSKKLLKRYMGSKKEHASQKTPGWVNQDEISDETKRRARVDSDIEKLPHGKERDNSCNAEEERRRVWFQRQSIQSTQAQPGNV